MGGIGEEDDARAGGYRSSSYHRVHELRVEGHVTGPDCVAGIVAAEDNSATAVVVVLVPGVDDHRAIRELIGLAERTALQQDPGRGQGKGPCP